MITIIVPEWVIVLFIVLIAIGYILNVIDIYLTKEQKDLERKIRIRELLNKAQWAKKE